MQTLQELKAEIATMPLAGLRNLDKAQEANLKHAQSIRAMVQEEILRRRGDDIGAAYAAAEKQYGDIRFTVEGVEMQVSVGKTVKWDQKALESIAAKMPLEEAQHYFDISFKVPEAKFKALPPSDFKKALEDAREVKYGEPKAKFGGGE